MPSQHPCSSRVGSNTRKCNLRSLNVRARRCSNGSHQWDSTSKSQVDESLRLFHNSNQRITGLILSQINPKGMKRYGYGGRYGAYGSYGSKYYNS